MIVLEAGAALVVGLAVLMLVLGPLARPAPPEPALDEPEEFEETPKGMALAALKEIEFDRATGKLSEEDYRELNARYTARAVEVLRAEEQQSPAAAPLAGAAGDPADPVEALIAARARDLASPARCPVCGPRPEPDALYCSSCGRMLRAAVRCAACGGPLETGGRFCGSCGAAVAA
jgi:hypothetical protein